MATKRRLGYGGSASINGRQVLITDGSFDEATTISYLNMVNTPASTTMAGRVKHADGTKSYEGSLSFDVHAAIMDIFNPVGGLLQRYNSFNVGINDGHEDWEMQNCKLSSLSITGGVGGVVSAQISFVALIGKQSVTAIPNAFVRDLAQPMGYWYTGNSDSNIKDWTLSMSQDVELVYKNQNTVEPAYIKVGLVSYALAVTSYNILSTNNIIKISTSVFTLTGNLAGSGYSFGGVTGIGTYSYTFETGSNEDDSTTLVIQ